MEFKYLSSFKMSNGPVNGRKNDVNAYLQEIPMEQFLNKDIENNKNGIDTSLKIISVKWEMVEDAFGSLEKGTVTVVSPRLLRYQEVTFINDWINGQNSDGLGEGFAQSDFCEYKEEIDPRDFSSEEDYIDAVEEAEDTYVNTVIESDEDLKLCH